jgi:phosphoglycolate phosphatase
MQLKGIIFDKDGTLFDYYHIWGPVFTRHTEKILEEFNRSDDEKLKERLLSLLGITAEGVNPDGLIFKHNGALMLFRLFIFSKRERLPYRRLISLLTEGYYDSKDDIQRSFEHFGDSGRLIPLFTALKQAGYIIGIVTSDNKSSTQVCLDHYRIADYVDMVSTYDDHFKNKPHPESFRAFCARFSLSAAEVVMVGDAPVDMKYAKNSGAGYTVGVMTGSGDRNMLEKYADVVYPTVLDLLSDPKLKLTQAEPKD